MGVSLVELNGMVGRTQDFSTMKQNEVNKPFVEQSNISIQQEKKQEQKAASVHASEESAKQENHADAKEKGHGNYFGDGGKNRKKQNEMSKDGRVIVKGQSHFDISV